MAACTDCYSYSEMDISCFDIVSHLQCEEELLESDQEVDLSFQSPEADDDDADLGEGEY